MPAEWDKFQRHNLSGTLPTLEHGRGMGSLTFEDRAFEHGTTTIAGVTFDVLNNASWTKDSKSASPSWTKDLQSASPSWIRQSQS